MIDTLSIVNLIFDGEPKIVILTFEKATLLCEQFLRNLHSGCNYNVMKIVK